jgi:uncharacterized protein (TIGR02145 family)
VTSTPGQYQGWYRITGATGYDIYKSNRNDSLYGRDRTQMPLTENYYTIETLGGTATSYQWSIDEDNSPTYASLGSDVTNATVELKFKESVLNKYFSSKIADTIFLQCTVTDNGGTYILPRKITVGDWDECSPIAGLLDAEGNRYKVSKFGNVCWMTENLRSTYTMQGTQKQELSEDKNILNDYNAVSNYYPNANKEILKTKPEYGLLYTWGAANIGTETTEATNAFLNKTSDRQGICPEGWVIPSDYDWNLLEKEIATNPEPYTDAAPEVTPLEWDTDYEIMSGWRPDGLNPTGDGWGRSMKSPTAVTATPNGVSKTDGTGFDVLLVGSVEGGTAANYGTYTAFWSGSAGSTTGAWRRTLGGGYSGANRGITGNRGYSFSVRCKKI